VDDSDGEWTDCWHTYRSNSYILWEFNVEILLKLKIHCSIVTVGIWVSFYLYHSPLLHRQRRSTSTDTVLRHHAVWIVRRPSAGARRSGVSPACTCRQRTAKSGGKLANAFVHFLQSQPRLCRPFRLKYRNISLLSKWAWKVIVVHLISQLSKSEIKK